MKRIFLLLFFCTGSYLMLSGQSITAAEYYIDDYVPPGSGTPLSLNSENLTEFSIPTASLTPGMHYLHVRVKNSEGIWSLYHRKTFRVAIDQVAIDRIVAAEYFWDQDPGLGNGIPLNVTAAETINLTEEISMAGLSPGFHILKVRVKNNAGSWYTYARKMVNLVKPVTEFPLVAYQYSFNQPPSSETEVAFGPHMQFDDNLQVVVPELPEGQNTIFMRMKDEDGKWSEVVSANFEIAACAFAAPVAVQETIPVDIDQPFSKNLADLFDLSATGNLQISILDQPVKGNFTFDQGSFTYTAQTGTVGLDSLQYKACNECDICDSTWYYFDIANQAPELTTGTFSVPYQGVLTVDLADHVFDINHNLDTASLEILTPLESNAVSEFTTNFRLVIDYGNTTFSGDETFTLRVCDNLSACTEQTFSVNVGGGAELVIYNAVSPNNDGNNDYMEITAIDQYPENKLTIINRWGDKVFEVENYDNEERRFEGKSNMGKEKELPSGTYFYELILKDQNQTFTGFLLLKY